MKLPHKSIDGIDIIFDEDTLEQAMKPYIMLRHTKDESRSHKWTTGYLIYAISTDYQNMPYIPYVFSRRTDAKFTISLIEMKIPEARRLMLYIKRKIGRDSPEVKAIIKSTKYEVVELSNEAREKIWTDFVV